MSFDGALFLKWKDTYMYGSWFLSLDSALSTFYGQAHSSGNFSFPSPHSKTFINITVTFVSRCHAHPLLVSSKKNWSLLGKELCQ